MLTRADMQRVASSLPSANQLALDRIIPEVNQQIREAAVRGRTECDVDVPAFLDTAPAYSYQEVCDRVVGTLRKGRFTVTVQNLGLYTVSWAPRPTRKEPGKNNADDDDEVRIIYSKGHGRRRK